MKGNNTSLVDDALEYIIMLLVVPRYEKSGFRIVFIQDVKNLVRV